MSKAHPKSDPQAQRRRELAGQIRKAEWAISMNQDKPRIVKKWQEELGQAKEELAALDGKQKATDPFDGSAFELVGRAKAILEQLSRLMSMQQTTTTPSTDGENQSS